MTGGKVEDWKWTTVGSGWDSKWELGGSLSIYIYIYIYLSINLSLFFMMDVEG